MTISYSGSFCKLLFRWRGSIWRCVWKELVYYYILYFTVACIYRFLLDDAGQKNFNVIILNFNEYLKLIPITFLLGFYVNAMVARYWNQFQSLAWPDGLCCMINLVIPGDDLKSRLRRRTMARYLVAACVLAWRDISTRVRKRFPQYEYLVTAGLFTESELQLYQKSHLAQYHWLLPIEWVQRIIEEMLHKEKTIAPPIASNFFNQLNAYRDKFYTLYKYNWLSVPLTYTQVASLATYAYFLFSIIGRQFIDPVHKVKGYELDFYIPIFTTLQFVFYIGWLKVGQFIMHPYGEDDDDFELNFLIDRHLKVALALVDEERNSRPPISEDDFIEQDDPKMPHTKASVKIKENFPKVKTGRALTDEDITIVDAEKAEEIQDSMHTSTYSALSKSLILFGRKKNKAVAEDEALNDGQVMVLDVDEELINPDDKSDSGTLVEKKEE